MADDLDKVRKDYEELFGKKPFNGWDAAELQKRIDEKLSGGVGGDSEEVASSPSATPSPTQAELDAIREGAFGGAKRKRDVKPESSASYKTR